MKLNEFYMCDDCGCIQGPEWSVENDVCENCNEAEFTHLRTVSLELDVAIDDLADSLDNLNSSMKQVKHLLEDQRDLQIIESEIKDADEALAAFRKASE